MNLYELSEAMRQVQEAAESGADESEVSEALEQLEGEFKDKAQGVAYVIRNLSALSSAISDEAKRLQSKKTALTSKIARLEQYLIENMRSEGIKSIDDGILRATVSKPRPIAVIEDDAAIPDSYMRIKTDVAVDKKLLLDDLKEGKEVPGAKLGDSKPGLTIK
jgi:hypothetical protein